MLLLHFNDINEYVNNVNKIGFPASRMEMMFSMKSSEHCISALENIGKSTQWLRQKGKFSGRGKMSADSRQLLQYFRIAGYFQTKSLLIHCRD